jgi:hypothetical protein
LTNTYNQTFDDAYVSPDWTYRYMYQTLSWYIQEIPFNSSVSVKVTDEKLNEISKVYIKTIETYIEPFTGSTIISLQLMKKLKVLGLTRKFILSDNNPYIIYFIKWWKNIVLDYIMLYI